MFLREIGGYYAGLNLHYDSLLMNLALMTGLVTHTPAALYHRLLRPGSITQAKATGFCSQASRYERKLAAAIYQRAFTQYERYLRGRLSSRGLAESIRNYCQTCLRPCDRQELVYESQRLRSCLGWSR